MTSAAAENIGRRRRGSAASSVAAPVFVIGLPFSGATALAWSLAQHPRFDGALGVHATDALAGAFAALEEDVLPLLRREVVDPVATAFGSESDVPGSVLAQIFRAVVAEAESSGAAPPRRWVVAGHEYLPRLPLAARLFPKLSVIQVTRDADAIRSALVAAALRDGASLSQREADAIYGRLTDACFAVEETLGRGRVFSVDHQELVTEPEQVLRDCLQFLAERWDSECLWPLRLLTTSPAEAAPAVASRTRRRRAHRSARVSARASRPAAVGSPSHRRFRQLVESVVPKSAQVLVVSKGDEQLLRFRERQGAHFPQMGGGVYAGFYPTDGAEAVGQLEQLRSAGASHLVFPRHAFWWLEHYAALRLHLEQTARLVACDTETAVVWELRGEEPLRLPLSLRAQRRVPREPDNERAFRIDKRTPPRRRPRLLPGRLWAITAFYNPAGYVSKRANYQVFRRGLAAAGVPLLTVELAFGEAPFELVPDDAEKVVQLRGGDVLWQKERLLNLAVCSLPDECDKVAWVDGDVLFARADWARETERLLNDYVVVQPFSHCVRLPKGVRDCEPALLPVGPGEGELFYGIAWGVRAKGRESLSRYSEHGHTGFAWAARRDLLETHGLYDANLLGNGDTDIAHAMFGNSEYWALRKLSADARDHLRRWADPFATAIRGSVGHVDGVLTHLWHGSQKHRLYDRPLEVLAGFSPDRDLVVDVRTGLYRWGDAPEQLRTWSERYFGERREDGE